jgi:hypothetical protein
MVFALVKGEARIATNVRPGSSLAAGPFSLMRGVASGDKRLAYGYNSQALNDLVRFGLDKLEGLIDGGT